MKTVVALSFIFLSFNSFAMFFPEEPLPGTVRVDVVDSSYLSFSESESYEGTYELYNAEVDRTYYICVDEETSSFAIYGCHDIEDLKDAVSILEVESGIAEIKYVGAVLAFKSLRVYREQYPVPLFSGIQNKSRDGSSKLQITDKVSSGGSSAQ